jgi:hypothetical protein
MTDYDQGYKAGYVAGLKKHLEQLDQLKEDTEKRFKEIFEHAAEQAKRFEKLEKDGQVLWDNGFNAGYEEGARSYGD